MIITRSVMPTNKTPRRDGRGCVVIDQSAHREGAHVGAAAFAVAPGFVEAGAAESVLDRQGRLRLDALGQRRVVRRLIAASLVVLGIQAARLDLRLARL